MGKAKIDDHGVHLYGCECESCTAVNVVCPACSRHYWSEPGDPQNECPRCMHHWEEQP